MPINFEIQTPAKVAAQEASEIVVAEPVPIDPSASWIDRIRVSSRFLSPESRAQLASDRFLDLSEVDAKKAKRT